MAKYTKKRAEQIAELVRHDCNWSEISEVLNISRRTLHRWYSGKEEFRKLIEEDKDESFELRLKLAESGQEKLLEGYEYTEIRSKYDGDGNFLGTVSTTKYSPPNAAVVMHTLKSLNPDQWSDKISIDHTTAGKSLNSVTVVIAPKIPAKSALPRRR